MRNRICGVELRDFEGGGVAVRLNEEVSIMGRHHAPPLMYLENVRDATNSKIWGKKKSFNIIQYSSIESGGGVDGVSMSRAYELLALVNLECIDEPHILIRHLPILKPF